MICRKCREVMRTKMHFESGRKYQFHECPKCLDRTKNKRIHFDDVLKEEVNKIKTN